MYTLTIGSLPKCWLKEDSVRIDVITQSLTKYSTHAILKEGGTRIDVTHLN